MPHANVWIRKENEAKWNAMASKSEWLNAILRNADDTSEWGKTIGTPVGPAVTVLTETLESDEDEEYDYLEDLIWDEATKTVYNTTTKEPEEADAAMVKELKRRKQTT